MDEAPRGLGSRIFQGLVPLALGRGADGRCAFMLHSRALPSTTSRGSRLSRPSDFLCPTASGQGRSPGRPPCNSAAPCHSCPARSGAGQARGPGHTSARSEGCQVSPERTRPSAHRWADGKVAEVAKGGHLLTLGTFQIQRLNLSTWSRRGDTSPPRLPSLLRRVCSNPHFPRTGAGQTEEPSKNREEHVSSRAWASHPS